MIEEVVSSKKNRIGDYSAKINTLFMTKMTKIDTLFMTKMAGKLHPWGRTYLYIPYKGVSPGGYSLS